MKKIVLFILTFVPIIIGYLVENSLMIPVIGLLNFYVLPLLTPVFWCWLGIKYSRSSWKAIPSLLIGNATGILSLLIYLWQFVFKTAETRNITLAVASQMFSASTPTYLLGRLAILFESQSNYTGQTTLVALQVISLIFMIIVFLCGYIWGKKKLQYTAIE